MCDMAKKNKPYNDNNCKKNNSCKGKSKKIENITRIYIDKFRLNDSDSLGTTFLEERVLKLIKIKK